MRKLYYLILSCALLLTQGMSVMAQKEAAPVAPGSQGEIPTNLPVLTPAHEGEFTGLRLERYQRDQYVRECEVELRFPDASYNDVDYYTLYIDGKANLDYDGNVKKYTSNASIYQNKVESTYQLVAHGGQWDGMKSNALTVTVPGTILDTYLRFWSWNTQWCVVGNTLTKPYVSLHYQDESVEKTFKYQWIRRNPNNYEDALIEGATGETYTPTLEDVGYLIVCRVSGDNVTNTFSVEFMTDEPIYFPVYCSFDYCDNDGFILNTSHALPDFQNKLKLFGQGWSWDDPNNFSGYVDFNDARELQKGQYLMAGDLDLMNVYYELMCDLGNPNVKLAAKYGEGEYMMIREVILRPDEGCRNLSIKNSSAITNGKVNIYGNNIYGDIVLKSTIDLVSNDTVVYLNKGNYYVQVMTGNSGDAPTYYPNATNWKQAQLLEVSDWDETPTEISIQKMAVAPVGTCRIEGTVKKAVVTRAIGNGVADINMLLLNDKKEVIASTTTNDNGEYSFINLAEGTYYVTPELANYEVTATEPVTLSNDAKTATASYTMGNGTFAPVSEASGITNAISSDAADLPAYDLLGRKNISAKGIKIIGNKKVNF